MNVLLAVDFSTGTSINRRTTLEGALKDAQICMRANHATRVEIYAPTRKLGVIVKRSGGKWIQGAQITPQGAGAFEARAVERIHRSLGFKN